MRFATLLQLVRVIPKYGRVIYCLYRDPRTPRWWKVGLGVALGVIWTPFINIPEVIPVLGQMEWVALTLLALRIAVSRAPEDLVADHERAIEEGTSIWHQDLKAAQSRASEFRTRRVGG